MTALKAKDDYKNIGGPEKAAMLLLSLGEDQLKKVFALLDEDEIKELSQIMTSLGSIQANVLEKVLHEFTEKITSTGSLVGSYESTERLLLKVLDKEKVSALMEDIRGPAGRTMWDKLGNVSEEVLANYLKNEYPQTVAVVLSKIKPEHTARVLAVFPESFAMEVVMRMLRMEPVQKDILEDVERTLRSEFMSNLARTNKRDAHELMAEIFNNFDRSTETKFLESLSEKNQEAADKIKSLMFTFEDLIKLDPASIQAVLRGADKSKLAVALKGASDQIKDLFFSNMSERAGKILKEDIAAMGPVRLKDVEEAQSSIILVTKDLAAEGKIVISKSNEEEELVY